MKPNDGEVVVIGDAGEEDRDAVAGRQLAEVLLQVADANLQHVIARMDAEGDERADVEREEVAGARRVG